VVRVAVPNSPTATLTSRATGSVEVQVRRPSRSAEGSSWSPVMSTVSSAGAETLMRVSATGLAAVSPMIPTNGSRAHPTPGSHASSGAPLAHQETPSAAPTRSNSPRPSVSVNSSDTSVDSPAGSSWSSRTTYSPPGPSAPASS
jgi:hypothetical protein